MMLQETVLAGQNPTEPAIDAATGQPLTIEELLRRRGLMAYGGNMRVTPLPGADAGAGALPTGSVPAAPVDGSAAAGATLDAASAGTGIAGGVASAGSSANPAFGNNGMQDNVDRDPTPEEAASFEQIDAETGGNGEGFLAELIAAGFAGAGLLYAYNRWRNRRGPAGGDQTARMTTPLQPDTGGGRGASPIIDGEFTEVRPQGIAAEQTRALPAPSSSAAPVTEPEATRAPQRANGGAATGGISPDARARMEESLAVAQRQRDNATSPGVREYWNQVVTRLETDLANDMPTPGRATAGTAARPSNRPPTTGGVGAGFDSLGNVLADRYTGGRRDRASQRIQRSGRTEPNDIDTLPMGRDVDPEVRREAESLADFLISRRVPQGSHRGRAGRPTAPVNRNRANEPRSNQREGLVNEMINILMQNRNAGRLIRQGVRFR